VTRARGAPGEPLCVLDTEPADNGPRLRWCCFRCWCSSWPCWQSGRRADPCRGVVLNRDGDGLADARSGIEHRNELGYRRAGARVGRPTSPRRWKRCLPQSLSRQAPFWAVPFQATPMHWPVETVLVLMKSATWPLAFPVPAGPVALVAPVAPFR